MSAADAVRAYIRVPGADGSALVNASYVARNSIRLFNKKNRLRYIQNATEKGESKSEISPCASNDESSFSLVPNLSIDDVEHVCGSRRASLR